MTVDGGLGSCMLAGGCSIGVLSVVARVSSGASGRSQGMNGEVARVQVSTV